jgi:NADH:ubiquinone oxidoreductase subunit B-like Fe-S oxidoreductase
MIVAGTVSLKMALIKRLYEQMPAPRYVISMGIANKAVLTFSRVIMLKGGSNNSVDVYIRRSPGPC